MRILGSRVTVHKSYHLLFPVFKAYYAVRSKNFFTNSGFSRRYVHVWLQNSKDGRIVEVRALGIYPNSVYAVYTCI